MHLLNPKFSLEEFFKKLHVEESLLLLDYDGTLAPFQIDPEKAVPYSGVVKRLERIMESSRTRLIIVSGRAIDSLLPLLPLDPLPEIWGCHGGERLAAGKKSVRALSERQQQGILKAKELARGTASENRCERKPLSIAIHWRGCSKEEIDAVRQALQVNAASYDLEKHEFDGGIEFRIKGMNKGGVISTIIKEVGVSPLLAYAGDDATDEEAFEALGSRGLKILVRKEFRPTLADIQLTPPRELLTFFDRWADAVKK
jgi:trehalose-phosphatase